MELSSHKKRPTQDDQQEQQEQQVTKKPCLSSNQDTNENECKFRVPLQDISNITNPETIEYLPTEPMHFRQSSSSSSFSCSSFISSSSVSSTSSAFGLRVSYTGPVYDEWDDLEADVDYFDDENKELESFLFTVSDSNHAIDTSFIATKQEKTKSTVSFLLSKQESNESELLKISKENSAFKKWSQPAKNSFTRLAQRQKLLMVSPTYMSHQPEINETMRSILIDWLVEVAEEFGYKSNVLFFTVCIIDAYLSQNHTSREKLQLVGIVALIVALSYEESVTPNIDEFVHISDNSYSKKDILQMENQMKKSFIGLLPADATVYSFLTILQKEAKADEEVIQLSRYLIELSLLEYSFLRFEPSKIAASALCLSFYSVGCVPCWSKQLQQYSKYQLQDLGDCIEELLILFNEAHTMQLIAIYEKYSNPNPYLCVSQIPPPATVPTL